MAQLPWETTRPYSICRWLIWFHCSSHIGHFKTRRIALNYSLGMNVIFRIFWNVVINGLQLVKDVLNGLHKDWLQMLCKWIRIIWVMIFHCECVFWLRRDILLSRLALKDKLGDWKITQWGCRGDPISCCVVFFSYMMQHFPNRVSDAMFCSTKYETHTNVNHRNFTNLWVVPLRVVCPRLGWSPPIVRCLKIEPWTRPDAIQEQFPEQSLASQQPVCFTLERITWIVWDDWPPPQPHN